MDNDLIIKLVETFKKEIENVGKKNPKMKDYAIHEYFRKNKKDKGYTRVEATFNFNGYILDIDYIVDGGVLLPKSTLEMRLMFENGTLPIRFSIYDILNEVDKENFNCYTIPYIYDEKILTSSINYLVDTYLKYQDNIKEISVNSNMVQVLQKNVSEQMVALLNENVFANNDIRLILKLLELYYVVDTSRFVSDAYLWYVDGDYAKSLKKFKKLKQKTLYEKRLVECMQDNKKIKNALPKELKNIKEVNKLRRKSSLKLIPFLLTELYLIPLWAIIYGAIFAITYYIVSRGGIYTSWSNTPTIPAMTIITSIIHAYYVKGKAYKLLFKKLYKRLIALDSIENTARISKVSTNIAQLIIAFGIVITVLSANSYIKFNENDFVVNTNMYSLVGKNISYDMVDCVYKSKTLVGDFGMKMDIEAYTIQLKDTTKITLNYYMDNEEIQKYVIPILKDKGIKIIDMDVMENTVN